MFSQIKLKFYWRFICYDVHVWCYRAESDFIQSNFSPPSPRLPASQFWSDCSSLNPHSETRDHRTSVVNTTAAPCVVDSDKWPTNRFVLISTEEAPGAELFQEKNLSDLVLFRLHAATITWCLWKSQSVWCYDTCLKASNRRQQTHVVMCWNVQLQKSCDILYTRKWEADSNQEAPPHSLVNWWCEPVFAFWILIGCYNLWCSNTRLSQVHVL